MPWRAAASYSSLNRDCNHIRGDIVERHQQRYRSPGRRSIGNDGVHLIHSHQARRQPENGTAASAPPTVTVGVARVDESCVSEGGRAILRRQGDGAQA